MVSTATVFIAMLSLLLEMATLALSSATRRLILFSSDDIRLKICAAFHH